MSAITEYVWLIAYLIFINGIVIVPFLAIFLMSRFVKNIAIRQKLIMPLSLAVPFSCIVVAAMEFWPKSYSCGWVCGYSIFYSVPISVAAGFGVYIAIFLFIFNRDITTYKKLKAISVIGITLIIQSVMFGIIEIGKYYF